MIKIKVGEKDSEVKKSPTAVNLQIRKTLDGKYMIFDHEDVDIIVNPKEMKVGVYPSELIEERVFEAQNRFFHFMIKKGIVDPSTVRAGNVFASLQGRVYESQEVNSMDMLLFNVSKWMDLERPGFLYRGALEDEYEDWMTDPEEDETTELGKVPHEDKKGGNAAPYHGLNTQMFESKTRKGG